MFESGTTQTSRSRPDMSVHWGEAVKVTPPAKWRFCGCRRETFGTDLCFTCSSARIGDSRRKTPDLFAYLG